MVMTTSCCFTPPPPTTTITTTQPPSSARYVKLTSDVASATFDPKREVCWRKRCVIGMACMVIGLQVEGIVGNNQDYAVAVEPKVVVELKKRWSGKRICPAWQLNSLETIVPEDLPRPSYKRRWEEIGDHSRVAPPVKGSPTTISSAASSDCFSM